MDDKFQAMKEGGHILAEILQELKLRTTPGITTKQIDDWTRRLCLKHGVKASFLGYQNYPAAICVSVNDEVVHGIPGQRILKEDDLISFDFGVYLKGYHTDAAISFVLGDDNKVAKDLIGVTKKSLEIGINEARVGNHIGDIGNAVQNYIEGNGYSVVRTLVGHGVGRHIHEDPMIPNFGIKGTGPKILAGMSIAIEPMVTVGNYEVYQESDGWTYKTADASLACHFEHTVYISNSKTVILTK